MMLFPVPGSFWFLKPIFLTFLGGVQQVMLSPRGAVAAQSWTRWPLFTEQKKPCVNMPVQSAVKIWLEVWEGFAVHQGNWPIASWEFVRFARGDLGSQQSEWTLWPLGNSWSPELPPGLGSILQFAIADLENVKWTSLTVQTGAWK